MNRRRWLIGLLVLWLVAAGSASADAAAGMLVSGSQLAAATAQSLQARIAQARAADPDSFVAVRRVIEDAPRFAEQARHRRALITPALRAIGPRALWPLVEYIAFASPDRAAFTDQQWLDVRCGVLEAAGMIRDAQALPAFDAVLADPAQPPIVTRFAAEAVGRIGDDDAVRALQTRLAAAGGERRSAILAGMGQCRRAAVARLLAAELRASAPGETRSALIEALRDVGNSWAWNTPAIAASGEGETVRRVAAAALVGQFTRLTAPEQEAATKALLVSDHPATPALVAGVRAVGPEDRAALDRLLARLQDNPLHH